MPINGLPLQRSQDFNDLPRENNLYVKNLPFEVDDASLKAMFQVCGQGHTHPHAHRGNVVLMGSCVAPGCMAAAEMQLAHQMLLCQLPAVQRMFLG